MSDRYGASPEAWHHYSSVLGLTADLLPVVSNPNATISPNSKMQALGKTPSWYNQQRHAAGIPEWTKHHTVEAEVRRWAQEPDYGIAMQTRRLLAFDGDIEDEGRALAIRDAIWSTTGVTPLRWRSSSSKFLLPFRRSFALTKRILPVDGGMLEILGDGQQFIAEGTHPKGDRYQWLGDLDEMMELTEEQFESLWLDLVAEFGTGTPKIARSKRTGSHNTALVVHDPVIDWLADNWENYDVGSDGQLFIECPFAEEHTSDSGPTSTAYFAAGTGGYAQGHFVCLHAHCAGRGDAEFLDATGYNLAQFEDLGGVAERSASGGSSEPPTGQGYSAGAVVPDHRSTDPGDVRSSGELPVDRSNGWPRLVRDKAGKIDPTADNLTRSIACADMVKKHIAYDGFKDEIVWAPHDQDWSRAQWAAMGDEDMLKLRIELEKRGFKPMGRELLRDSVWSVARDHRIDTAQEWLGRLVWDGTERVARFAAECWGWAPGDYSSAVSRYTWSALAGRILRPGVRADMAPILAGPQGLKKTSAIQMMVPNEEFYVEINLAERDDNLSRRLRGKLVGELEELRGLNSRAVEEIKAFITRRHESWVPKFKEFENRFWRRLIMFGTGNEDEILNDPTGERRWLPGHCQFIDLEKIVAWREQLWAEGAVLFRLEGVMWEDAERLAPVEHRKFKVGDSWEAAIQRWLEQPQIGDVKPLDKGYVEVGEVLAGAIGVPLSQANRGYEIRVTKALRNIGLLKRWSDELGTWVYRAT